MGHEFFFPVFEKYHVKAQLPVKAKIFKFFLKRDMGEKTVFSMFSAPDVELSA